MTSRTPRREKERMTREDGRLHLWTHARPPGQRAALTTSRVKVASLAGQLVTGIASAPPDSKQMVTAFT